MFQFNKTRKYTTINNNSPNIFINLLKRFFKQRQILSKTDNPSHQPPELLILQAKKGTVPRVSQIYC